MRRLKPPASLKTNNFRRNSPFRRYSLSYVRSRAAKERNLKTQDMWRRLWQPPGEALEAITAAMRAHWRAAGDRTLELFWPAPGGSWLHPQKVRAGTHHFARGGRLIR